MSNTKLIIEERAADIGNFMVGRLLPFRQKRMVGPFIFIDHMGPVQLKDGENMDVDMHPHIGLSTLTYLFEGSVFHRDSLGSAVEITPGAVNWMTAGKGVVHTERTPERFRHTGKPLHGLQIWVALPKELEQCDPSFAHIGESELPAWIQDEARFKLIAGSAFGQTSPVPVHSPLYFIEIATPKATELAIGEYLFGESALYILEGAIQSDGYSYGPKQLLVAKESSLCAFTTSEGTKLYLFGGDPFPEERFIEWNFVSSDKAVIEKAKDDWKNGRFPGVATETARVPLPPPRKGLKPK